MRDYDNDDVPVTKDKIVTIGFSFSGKYNKHHVPTIELQLRQHLTKKTLKNIVKTCENVRTCCNAIKVGCIESTINISQIDDMTRQNEIKKYEHENEILSVNSLFPGETFRMKYKQSQKVAEQLSFSFFRNCNNMHAWLCKYAYVSISTKPGR